MSLRRTHDARDHGQSGGRHETPPQLQHGPIMVGDMPHEGCEVCDLQAKVERLAKALVIAAIPLEVLHATGNDWTHPRLRRHYKTLISASLRDGIEEAVAVTRQAIKEVYPDA